MRQTVRQALGRTHLLRALASRAIGRRSTRRVRLGTLVGLRWLAIAGQSAAILLVGVGLGFPMPIALCFALVATSAWLNLFLQLRFPPSFRLRDTPASLLLGYDLLQLGGLLYLTGGLENPFSLLLLVPVMVSATSLSPLHTIGLGGLALLVSSVLVIDHWPLPWLPAGEVNHPLLYVLGAWVALFCTLAFMGVFTFRVAEETRQLADALAATELVLAREHHLATLDGLAAAAAHELGTPLATIALVARELARDAPPGSHQAEDVALLISQSQRCRDILGRLTSLSAGPDWSLSRQTLGELIAEVSEPHREFGIDIVRSTDRHEGPEPVCARNPAILYGIGNLIENAVDFAESTVEITAGWTRESVTITIADDGPGFAPDIIDRIGEPYVTTRANPAAAGKPDHEAGGLGLGLFIAKTFLERSGAQLELTNRTPPRQGAVVRIRWRRAAFELQSDAAGQPPRRTAPQIGPRSALT